jgi:hypothetical protein
LISNALEGLRDALTLDAHHPPPASHGVIHISGIEADQAVSNLGIYLVGIIASVVAVDLSVSERYLGAGPDYAEELRRDVERVIGATNQLTDGFRNTRRNPWVAECLAHLLLMITGQGPGVCVPGRVWAATVPHDKVSKQGLDLLAVYDDDGRPSLCIGESKASALNAAHHLNASIRLFREVDARERDYEIRVMMINSLDSHIPTDVRDQVPGMFWRDRRLYMSVIGFLGDSGFDASTDRPGTFGTLLVTVEHRKCVSLALQDFHGFFDAVADKMREAIPLYTG